MKNKILLLSSLVATTYSADFGHSASPLSYNLVNTKYLAINLGISNNSDFLSLIDKEKFPSNTKKNDVKSKMKDQSLYTAEKVNKIKGQLAGIFGQDTVTSLNLLQAVSAIVDINIIFRPAQQFHVSWQAMTIARHAVMYSNLREENKVDDDKKDGTSKMLFWASFILPTFTLNIPYVAIHISTSKAVFYGTQLQYGVKKEEEPMKFYAGVLLSSIRICFKLNNPMTSMIAAKALDLGFAAVAAYCLKDFSFKYWEKKETK